jgi:hypothetical protein
VSAPLPEITPDTSAFRRLVSKLNVMDDELPEVDPEAKEWIVLPPDVVTVPPVAIVEAGVEYATITVPEPPLPPAVDAVPFV